ncbi:MAG: aminopeptidase [Terracidiphilus sp.]
MKKNAPILDEFENGCRSGSSLFATLNRYVPLARIPNGRSTTIASLTTTAWYLLSQNYPPEFIPGARSAVFTCLRIQPDEKVTLITDRVTEPIAVSIAAQLAERGCSFNAFILEDFATRPLNDMPPAVLEDMETSQVSIFAVQVQPNELHSRMQMTDVVNRRRMRHAHMVNITPEIMCDGMRADYDQVDRLSQQVLDRVRRATRIRATTAAGTSIVSDMNPEYRWFKTSGIISAEKWGNLPGGECFTSPGEVNGIFVVDGVVGDWLCARYGLLPETPLTIEIAQNRIVSCSSTNKQLEKDFWAYTHTDENSDRVGEFAIGTNIGVSRVIGNILQDEKFPGIHIAFGNPYGEHTGAPWRSGTHIDVVGLGFNIWLESSEGEEQIMREGRFLISA